MELFIKILEVITAALGCIRAFYVFVSTICKEHWKRKSINTNKKK